MKRLLAVIFVAACWTGESPAPSEPQPEPQQIRYNRDLADVFRATLEATREKYPNLEETEPQRRITTAWHLFAAPVEKKDSRFFARLDIRIDGGPPWAIRIAGAVSEWHAQDPTPIQVDHAEWLDQDIALLREQIDSNLRH